MRHLIVRALEDIALSVLGTWRTNYPQRKTPLAKKLHPIALQHNIKTYQSIINRTPHLKKYREAIFKHLWNDVRPLLYLINPKLILQRFAKKQSVVIKFFINIPDYEQKVFTGTLEEMAPLYPTYYPHLFKEFLGTEIIYKKNKRTVLKAKFKIFDGTEVSITEKRIFSFDYQKEKEIVLNYLKQEITKAIEVFFYSRTFKNIVANIQITLSDKGPEFFKAFENMLRQLLEFAITTMIETIEKDFDKEYKLWSIE